MEWILYMQRLPYYKSGRNWWESIPKALPGLKAILSADAEYKDSAPVRITNLGEEGCFIFFQKDENTVKREHIKIVCADGWQMSMRVTTVFYTEDKLGIGLKFRYDEKSGENMEDLLDILGYDSEEELMGGEVNSESVSSETSISETKLTPSTKSVSEESLDDLSSLGLQPIDKQEEEGVKLSSLEEETKPLSSSSKEEEEVKLSSLDLKPITTKLSEQQSDLNLESLDLKPIVNKLTEQKSTPLSSQSVEEEKVELAPLSSQSVEEEKVISRPLLSQSVEEEEVVSRP